MLGDKFVLRNLTYSFYLITMLCNNIYNKILSDIMLFDNIVLSNNRIQS
jgi:hypothetical protein